jgi:hypothetical protein
MPDPIAVCIEDLSPSPGAPRFVRCVAVAGALPGLRLCADGALLWRSDAPAACELWVSGDERLILRRPEGAPQVRVSRAGRSILAPFGKPVVVIHGDEIELGDKRFRLHVHGKAPAVHAPAPLPAWGTAGRVAAVVAMGAAVAGCKTGIEVRDAPPSVAVLNLDASGEPLRDAGADDADAPGDAVGAEVSTAIEVREAPPVVVPIEPPKPPDAGKRK